MVGENISEEVGIVLRARNDLINASWTMSTMISKLRSIESIEVNVLREHVRSVDANSDVITDKKVLALIQEIRDVDVFNFDQDVAELIENIESSQATLDNYISAFKRLV